MAHSTDSKTDEDLAPPPQRHSAPVGSLAEIPDYRWDKRPDYDWGSHHERSTTSSTSPPKTKRNTLRRAQSVGSSDFRRAPSSDLTSDHEPRMPTRRQSSDDIGVDYNDHSDNSDASGDEFGGDKEEDASESSGSCYSDSSEESIDLKGKGDDDDDSSSSSDKEADLHDSFMNDHEEDAEEVGYNWRTRRRIMRCKSDLTLYESKDDNNTPNQRNSRGGKRPRKILVKINEKNNQIHELEPLTDEDKAAMFYTKREIREMRDDRERERAEREYEKRNRQYADNSSKIGSIFSSAGGPKKAAQPPKKRNSAVERLHGEKQAKELEKEKKMQEMLDSLQLAMAQAKMVTGY